MWWENQKHSRTYYVFIASQIVKIYINDGMGWDICIRIRTLSTLNVFVAWEMISVRIEESIALDLWNSKYVQLLIQRTLQCIMPPFVCRWPANG